MTETRRKWFMFSFFTLVILFISALIYSIFLYVDLNNERVKGHDETRRELLNQTSLTEITKIENYNGEEPYHVVYGKNDKGIEKIIFYPLKGNEKTLKTIDNEDAISRSAMINLWQDNCSSCQLVKLTPAIMDNEILWELIYYDEDNHYVFDYRSIYDGSHYEEIRYFRQFN